jgi:hypothetical protein
MHLEGAAHRRVAMADGAYLGNFQGWPGRLQARGDMLQIIGCVGGDLVLVTHVTAIEGPAAELLQNRKRAMWITKKRFVVAVETLRLTLRKKASLGTGDLRENVLGVDALLEHFSNVAVAEALFGHRTAQMAVLGAVNPRNRQVRNDSNFRSFVTPRARNHRMRAKLLMHVFRLDEEHMRRVVALIEIAESTVLMAEQAVIRITSPGGRPDCEE